MVCTDLKYSLKTCWVLENSLEMIFSRKPLEFEEPVLEFYEKGPEYLRIQQNKFILTWKD